MSLSGLSLMVLHIIVGTVMSIQQWRKVLLSNVKEFHRIHRKRGERSGLGEGFLTVVMFYSKEKRSLWCHYGLNVHCKYSENFQVSLLWRPPFFSWLCRHTRGGRQNITIKYVQQPYRKYYQQRQETFHGSEQDGWPQKNQ